MLPSSGFGVSSSNKRFKKHHMDQYFREVGDDLIVPNDQETSETQCHDYISLSSDDWFQLDFDACDEMTLPNKVICRSMKPTTGELSFSGQFSYAESGVEHPICGSEGSSNHSACGELPVVDPATVETSSSRHGFVDDRPDFQLYNSTERMNDIFLTSLLEEGPLNVGIPYRSMSFENLLPEMFLEPECFAKGEFQMESWQNLKTWDFPLPIEDAEEDGEKLEIISPSHVISYDLKKSEGSRTLKDPVFSAFTSKESSLSAKMFANEHRQKCLGETVLQDLEDTMTQLSSKTRICFRDALYRLAQISNHHHSAGQKEFVKAVVDGHSGIVNDDGSLRPNTAESKTNALDRTIANLMFNEQNCSQSDLPTAGSIYQSKEAPFKLCLI